MERSRCKQTPGLLKALVPATPDLPDAQLSTPDRSRRWRAWGVLLVRGCLELQLEFASQRFGRFLLCELCRAFGADRTGLTRATWDCAPARRMRHILVDEFQDTS